VGCPSSKSLLVYTLISHEILSKMDHPRGCLENKGMLKPRRVSATRKRQLE
jgi:hypothetical protein